MYEEYQQTAIQTTIVPCPQNSYHGLDTVFCNPNKNRRWPAALRKMTKSAKLIRIQLVIGTNRRLDSFLYEAAQIFEVFSNFQMK